MSPFKDLTGQRFGRWLILGRSTEPRGRVYWRCQCDCGKIKSVMSKHLISGKSKSCGCLTVEVLRNKATDLKGQVFGRWKVIERSIQSSQCGAAWICECLCGNVERISALSLVSGSSKSCGCLSKELHTTHGYSDTPIYHVWSAMIQRCNNPNSINYYKYGARGISVCLRWLSFENFFEDMGLPPQGYSLDRVDNNGNYERENCRWATVKQQSNNTRQNIRYEYSGKCLTLSEWSELTEIPYGTLHSRINNYNWSVERALTEAIHINRRKRNGEDCNI